MNISKYSAVIGANGQDGFLMTRFLLKKKIKTLAVTRSINTKLKNIDNRKLKIIKINQLDHKNLNKIKKYKIDNFYFFAGYSKIPVNKIEKKICIKSNYEILKNFLFFFEKNFSKSKLLYLSSGEIFGKNQITSKKENSKLKGENCYSICKIKSHKLIESYVKKNYLFQLAFAIIMTLYAVLDLI